MPIPFADDPSDVVFAYRVGEDEFNIETFSGGVGADGILQNTSIEIRVYN